MVTGLVTVVSGDAYHQFAEALFFSAQKHFRPTEKVRFIKFEGEAGWPEATMCRHNVLLENFPWYCDFIYLVDADMIIEGEVGPEILPPNNFGIVATQHPGYVGKPWHELPYDWRPESACHVGEGQGGVYYCGGFFGGDAMSVATLLSMTAERIEQDKAKGITPQWHDESALNSVLAINPPALTLSPSFCYPDADHYYRTCVWTEDYPRKIVAIDKDAETRGER